VTRGPRGPSTHAQDAPIARRALAGLQAALDAARGSVGKKQSLLDELEVVTKGTRSDVETLVSALRAYEAAMNSVAAGSASIIHAAGLQTRSANAPPAALGRVTAVHSKPGKLAGEAIVSWPAAPGASHYAIEVIHDPAAKAGPFTALPSGSNRRRVVKGPAPSSQILARVAAVKSDGTQSEWSMPILVTTR
jgi:hypothetical protein